LNRLTIKHLGKYLKRKKISGIEKAAWKRGRKSSQEQEAAGICVGTVNGRRPGRLEVWRCHVTSLPGSTTCRNPARRPPSASWRRGTQRIRLAASWYERRRTLRESLRKGTNCFVYYYRTNPRRTVENSLLRTHVAPDQSIPLSSIVVEEVTRLLRPLTTEVLESCVDDDEDGDKVFELAAELEEH